MELDTTPGGTAQDEELEGLDTDGGSWGDYPIDKVLIRHENRTIHDVLRRIKKGTYVMDPDFQRDFIWGTDKQSKLIESVVMRIPLPVFYMAENPNGDMVVVDGLQRLSTFQHFATGNLRLILPDRPELHRKTFDDLPAKLQNRIEDCNLIFYVVDSQVPERARLDIFERVNGGIPLTRQQMRNCLFMGPATHFLKDEAQTEIFRSATGSSLSTKTMRDREFVNRFAAFQLLGLAHYRGDMDGFLADCLTLMNKMDASDRGTLSSSFRRSLQNNHTVFGRHAFRKHAPDQQRRSVLNASLWDVLSTSFTKYDPSTIAAKADDLRAMLHDLLTQEDFNTAITYGTNDTKRVKCRFEMVHLALQEVMGADKA